MANPHFSTFQFSEDSELLRQLNEDTIYDRGIEVRYFPREAVVTDNIMHENLRTILDTSYAVDILIQPDNSEYFGVSPLYDFAGFANMADNIKIEFDKDKFIAIVGRLPREEDVIYIEELDKAFELVDVDNRDPFLSGGRHYIINATMAPWSPQAGSESVEDIFGGDIVDKMNKDIGTNDTPIDFVNEDADNPEIENSDGRTHDDGSELADIDKEFLSNPLEFL